MSATLGAIATAHVAIVPDTRDFEKQLVDKTRSTATSVGQMFARVFGAAAFGAGMKRSIDAASDLNETVSKTKVIFGDAADAMIKASEGAARSMGMSKKAYLDATTNLKGLLDNMGLASEQSTQWSRDLVGLGGDLASFFNTDPADAIYAITAALRGESEPIRRYNVQLNEMNLKQKALSLGLYEGKGALSANAKAQAALALIMEQTTSAQGDFARTADGAANSTRIAKAETENAAASLGQNFLPVYQRIVQVVGFLAEQFGKLPPVLQIATVALIGVAALSGPISSVVGSLRAMATAITNLGTATKVGLGVFGLAVTAATTLWAIFSDDGEDATKDVADATKDLAVQLRSATAELLQNAEAIRKLRGELPDTSVGMTTLSNAMLDAFEAADPGSAAEITSILGEMGYTAEDTARVLGVLTRQVSTNSLSTQRFAEEINGLEEGTLSYGEAVEMLGGDLGQVNTPMGRLIALIRRTNEETADGAPDVEAMARAFIDQARGASELTAGLVDQAEAQATANGASDDAIAAYLAYIDISADLSDEQRRLALDLDAAAAAGADAATGVDDAAAAADRAKIATGKLRDEITGTTTKFDALADAADNLRSALDRVMGGSMNLADADRALEQAKSDLREQFEATDEAGVRLSNTLDITTERGRENAAAVQAQVDAILDQGAAMVGAGASTEDATAAMMLQTLALRDQLIAYGLTEEQANEYLETLGLTPENITTAVKLADDEAAKKRIDDLLERVGELDEGTVAEITALVDQGKYTEAERKLKDIARARNIPLTVTVSGGGTINVTPRPGGNKLVVSAFASGVYADRPTLGLFGEAGPEVILPLTKKNRMAQLLGDPRVRTPVLEAVASGGARATSRAAAPVDSSTGDTFVLVGWSEAMMRDLESRLTARKRGRK